jgi:hypothetical protein
MAQAKALAADAQTRHIANPQVAAYPPVLHRLIPHWGNEDILKGGRQLGCGRSRPAFAAGQQQQQQYSEKEWQPLHCRLSSAM